MKSCIPCSLSLHLLILDARYLYPLLQRDEQASPISQPPPYHPGILTNCSRIGRKVIRAGPLIHFHQEPKLDKTPLAVYPLIMFSCWDDPLCQYPHFIGSAENFCRQMSSVLTSGLICGFGVMIFEISMEYTSHEI